MLKEKCKEEVVKNAEKKVVDELQEAQKEEEALRDLEEVQKEEEKELLVLGEGGVRGAG